MKEHFVVYPIHYYFLGQAITGIKIDPRPIFRIRLLLNLTKIIGLTTLIEPLIFAIIFCKLFWGSFSID